MKPYISFSIQRTNNFYLIDLQNGIMLPFYTDERVWIQETHHTPPTSHPLSLTLSPVQLGKVGRISHRGLGRAVERGVGQRGHHWAIAVIWGNRCNKETNGLDQNYLDLFSTQRTSLLQMYCSELSCSPELWNVASRK